MYLIREIVDLCFSIYMLLIFAVVLGSWFPNAQRFRVMRVMRSCVDPYLNFFRRIIPPIGGVLDLSPLLAFIALSVIKEIVLNFFR